MFDTIKQVIKNPMVLFQQTCWRIGIVQNYSEEDIFSKDMENIHWIYESPEENFYADPFITDYFGPPIVFFERFSEKDYHGNISYVYLEDVLSKRYEIHTALDLPTHLSYPYLLEYDGELYMIPENNESHTISLYKSIGSPDKWEYVTTLIDNFNGIDTVIFEYHNHWWMFSTVKKGRSSSENSELHIWHSNTPLSGWKPHKLNPIQYDNPVARGGGKPFIVDDILYRPVQDCSRVYGGELLIKEVSKLTENEFSEKTIKKIVGKPPFDYACHTFNCSNSIAVIDVARIKYSFTHIWYLIKNSLFKK